MYKGVLKVDDFLGDVGPLIEALEKEHSFSEEDISPIMDAPEEETIEYKVNIVRDEDGMNEVKLGSFDSQPTAEEIKQEENEISEQLENTEKKDGEKDSEKENKESEKSVSLGKDKSLEKDNNNDLSVEVKRNSKVLAPLSKSSKGPLSCIEMDEHSSTKGSKIVIFTKRAIIQSKVVVIRLEVCQLLRKRPKLIASCYESTSPGHAETLELPFALADKKDLTIEEVLEYMVIEFDPFRVSMNPAKVELKGQDSFSSHNDASIALDISGNQTEKDLLIFHRSGSVNNPASASAEERPARLLRGDSYGALDTSTGKERSQYLGRGMWRAMPPPVDDAKRLTLAIKVPEVKINQNIGSQQGKFLSHFLYSNNIRYWWKKSSER